MTENSWTLSSPLSKSEARLDQHLSALLAMIGSKSVEIATEAERNHAGIQLVGFFGHANDGASLSREHLRTIAGMGLCLDFDFYYVGSGIGPQQNDGSADKAL